MPRPENYKIKLTSPNDTVVIEVLIDRVHAAAVAGALGLLTTCDAITTGDFEDA